MSFKIKDKKFIEDNSNIFIDFLDNDIFLEEVISFTPNSDFVR